MTVWSVRHISDVLNSFGWYGHMAGALLVMLQTIFPFVPFFVVAGVNVLLFGFWGGFAVNYICSCLGAAIVFFAARNFGRPWVQARLAKYSYIERFNEKLERHGLLYMILLRLLPVLPSSVINLSAAVMKVRPLHFVAGTLIGKAPVILLESMIGHDLLHFQHYKGRLMILAAIFIVLLLVSHFVKDRWFNSSKTGI
ncbi:TVP38/TMEM64 family inner membrane protein YdjZ [Paenibacillus solanacearum]|uniref:TVP38/TMEM64 family membrane protein n=1 Tax=Paenibacillus solanacearum TaxID=2048548 RepID=A0A916JUP7_9BACL|nr:TVP38/TMEM64 family protein [Paenibacillus solanacearum]CAG7604283.1 TVP38/TMEM64 family inner membrane protein YdjZ [Paenibacillus solanacearum]